MIRCNCCQADIKSPVWVNGYPYGFVCAGKLTGTKHKKPTTKWNEYTGEYAGFSSGKICLIVGGEKIYLSVVMTKIKGQNSVRLKESDIGQTVTVYTVSLK